MLKVNSIKRHLKTAFKRLLGSAFPETAAKARVTLTLSKLEPTTLISLVNQSQNLAKQYPLFCSVEEVVLKHSSVLPKMGRSLDLGCGDNPRNPFNATEVFGVDIRSDLPAHIKQGNLAIDSIPFESNYFDFCTAFDVLEHIPRNSWPNGVARASFIELMNEIHRVLKPGGFFLHSTPAYPSKQAFQDPTHVNIITEDTMPSYFCEPNNLAKKLGYGFREGFELIDQGWIDHIWIVGLLRASKE